ncbi:MAG: type II secretion system F family protein [Nitrospirota bacterium]
MIEKTLKINDLLIIFEVMADSAHKGVPWEITFDNLKDIVSADASSVIEKIKDGRVKGYSLSKSLKDAGISDILCSIVEAGEEHGKLPEALDRCREILKHEKSMKDTIKNITIYPRIVMFVVFAIVIPVLLSFVFPRFRKLLDVVPPEDVPSVLSFMVGVSEKFADYIYATVPIYLTILFILYRFATSPLAWRLYRMVPLVQRIERGKDYTLSFFMFSLMLATGIMVDEIAGAVSKIVSNPEIKRRFERMVVLLRRGIPLPRTAKEVGFEGHIASLLSTGELTGNLEYYLNMIAHIKQKEVEILTNRLLNYLQPVLIGGLVIIIGSIAGAIIIPTMKATMAIR